MAKLDTKKRPGSGAFSMVIMFADHCILFGENMRPPEMTSFICRLPGGQELNVPPRCSPNVPPNSPQSLPARHHGMTSINRR